jgi:hypothetical protein
MAAAIWTYLIPVYIIGFLALLLGIFGLLSRIRGGKYAAPIVRTIQKVPFLNKWLTNASKAALEKRNPDLASAIKKLERSGATRDPMRAQQALARLTPAERRAYMEAAEQQGITPESQGAPLGRAERRRMERMQKGMKRGGR